MSLHVVILAAGQGKRMFSKTPKVLHPIGGKPMLVRVVETAISLGAEKIHVIIGHEGERIQSSLSELPVNWVQQTEQLGTGHALLQALPFIPAESDVLVLSGDVPLIKKNTLERLTKYERKQQTDSILKLLITLAPDPFGLGRVIRNSHGNVEAIIEEKDATEVQRQIKEVYTGICFASANALQRWLPALSNNNAQGEYYLTEIIKMAVTENCSVLTHLTDDLMETQGVNNRVQLQDLERNWQLQIANNLMLAGVTLADARRIDVRGELSCGQDVFIDVNNIFIGKNSLGDGTQIGPNCVLTNVTLGKNCIVYPNSTLENCHMEDNCHIGPFARVRPGTYLASNCKIGNFVEVKNTQFAQGSKANHLTYLGDTVIGKDVNVGAGTITCNYDGVNKHKTIIEDGAFIGSDTQLVAPVVIGKNATIGAGSTIRKDAPPGELTLTESRQKTVYGWSRPKKIVQP